jgi:DNA polymerase-3 subunit alpha
MDQIPTYARGKRDPERIVYRDERLRPILEETKGVILYQEQAMRISKELAGFSGARADDLRKAIGKKKRDKMALLEPEFRKGCAERGVAPATIDWLWQTNEKSADYSFNKSHAACYGLIGYRTAWLKANYPAEYMAALISSVMDTKDKVPFFVAQAEQMGIEILPPDVNESDHEFTVHGRSIRFGLDAVKGVGYAAVEAIKAAREDEGGPFTSLWDFCERVDGRAVNRKAIEALIKCGAFGSTGASRQGMLAVLEQAQSAGQKSQLDAQIGQASIFDLGGGSDAAAAFAAPTHPPIPSAEADQSELLAWEKESIGLFISAHPLKDIREAMQAKCDCTLGTLGDRKDGDRVAIGGIVAQAKRLRTKKGDMMMFATLDDLEAQVELVIFAKALEEFTGELDVDAIVLVKGRVDHKEPGKTTIVVNEIAPFDPTPEEVARAKAAAAKAAEPPKPFRLALDAGGLRASVLEELKGVFSSFPGEADVVLELAVSGGRRRLKLGPDYRVTPSAALRAELHSLLGEAVGTAAEAAAA